MKNKKIIPYAKIECTAFHFESMPSKVGKSVSPPKNTVIPLVSDTTDDDEINVVYSMKFSKKDFGNDSTDKPWKEAVWIALKTMRNIDDQVVITPGQTLNAAIQSFGNADPKAVHLAFAAEALTQAMRAPAYKEPLANQS